VAINVLVLAIVAASAVLLGATTTALGPPVLKMMRSGQALRVSQGLLLAMVMLAELAIVIALAVVVARL